MDVRWGTVQALTKLLASTQWSRDRECKRLLNWPWQEVLVLISKYKSRERMVNYEGFGPSGVWISSLIPLSDLWEPCKTSPSGIACR